ncbi:MAG: response regulator transcription factor [Crocinitomix sp.]|nr:response regulator transcription factor [Crocinitomix sp.]
MKILIIEDEINCVEALSTMLRSCSNEITALENVASVEEALKKLENFHPDLVFIDVQLGEQTCFDLLDQLGKVDFQLVFTTAYDNYAIRAFEYSALHYLLKPMLLSDIKEALARYTKNHTTTSTIQSSIEKAKNLYLKTTLKDYDIAPDEILYIEADGSYSTIYLENKGSIFISKNLADLHKLLPDCFFRIHHSILVNIKSVKGLNKIDSVVVLKNGVELQISRRKKANFKVAMLKFK